MKQLSISLLLFAAALPGAAPPPWSSTLSVGAMQVPYESHPDFDVAADDARKLIHFVWRCDETLRHISSRDGGKTWSAPQVIAEPMRGGPRAAVDGAGMLHVVYPTPKEDIPRDRIGGRVWHRAWDGKRWTQPVEVLKVVPITDVKYQVSTPRITVDGNDNVHVLGWKLVSDPKDWKTRMRAAYARKLKGKAEFEPTLEFSLARDGEGGGGSGDITTDPKGDVHLFYVSFRPGKFSTTHFSRRKTGEWSEKVDVFVDTSTDFGLSTAVDRDGVLHVAGQCVTWSNPKPFLPISWTYYNNRADRSQLEPVHKIDDLWEYGAELLLAPNGDVWMIRGHWQKGEPLFAMQGRYVRMDARTGKWSEPVNLSPEGYRNADWKYGQVPKFAMYGGKVRIFYAEAPPDGAFKFLQRIFE